MIPFSIIILSSLFAIFLGWRSHKKNINSIEEKINFLYNYQNKFIAMATSYANNKFDEQIYIYLTENSNKVQIVLGQTGRIYYKPPFSAFAYDNYPIVLNTIPQFRARTIENFDISSSDDTMIRKIGILKESKDYFISQDTITHWFQLGSQMILALPIKVLEFFGILPHRCYNTITSSKIFKVINGIIWFLGLLSAVITIFTGWDAFIRILTMYFKTNL